MQPANWTWSLPPLHTNSQKEKYSQPDRKKQPHSDKEVIVGNSLKKLVTSGGDKDKVELAGVGGNRSKMKVSLGHLRKISK